MDHRHGWIVSAKPWVQYTDGHFGGDLFSDRSAHEERAEVMRPILLTAVLTGLFCGGFAMAIDVLTDMLDRTNVLMVSFASGFLGSLFAQTVMKRWRNK